MIGRLITLITATLVSFTMMVPVSALGAKKEAKGKKKENARPTLKLQDFYEKKELQVGVKRREAIQMIKKLIAEGVSDEKEKPDLYFRLAELYWEEGESWYMQGMSVDDDKNLSRADKKRKKREYFKKQKKFQLKAINLYKSIVTNYPTFYKNDEVLFYLAQSQSEVGLEKESLYNYRRLIKDYRKSRFIPDAYLAFGEYYFDHNDLEKGLRAYLKVATFKEAKVYPYALYKIGWCYYNLGHFEKALKKFEQVIKLQKTGRKGQKKMALRREAIKDLVRTYAQVGEPKEAKDYFLRVAGEKDYKWMLEGLAIAFSDQGMDDYSSEIYRVLISMNPQNPKNPVFQAKIVSNTQRLGDKKRTVLEVSNLVRIYKTFLEQDHPAKIKKKIERKVDKQIRMLTEIYHSEAQKTKNTSTYKLAFKLYSLYLKLFPDSPKADEMRFYYADLAYKLRKYKLAAEEYTKVLKKKCGKAKDKKDKGILADAAFGAVSAWERLSKRKLSHRGQVRTKKKGQEYKPEPLPEPEKKMLEACGNYVKCVPNGDQALKVAYNSALIFYKHNHFKEAIRRFAFITEKHPEAREAEASANLILDSFNILRDWKSLNHWARKFLKDKVISGKEKGKMKDRLKKLIEESQFKIVEAMAKGQKGAKVAEAWLAFVKEFPKSSVGDMALYNASVHYMLDKMIDKAINVRERLIKEYPKSKLLAKTTYQLATNYEQLAEWEKGAKHLENFYKLSEKRRKKALSKDERDFFKKNADKALKRAGIYREALGQYRKAVDDCQTYARVFRKNKDAHKVFFRIGLLYEKAKMWRKAADIYKKYRKFKGDPNLILEASTRRGLMLQKMRKRKDAKKAFVETIKLFNGFIRRKKVITNGEQWVAQADFILAQDTFDEFKAVKLKLPQKKLEKLLIKKASLLQKTEARYKRLLRYKHSDWPIAALFKIGMAYQDFAKSLIKAPVPPGMTPEQREIYRSELESRAIPVEEKAMEAYTKGLQASGRLDIYNNWVTRTERKLAEVRPEEYPADTELLYSPEYMYEGFVGAGLISEGGR
ncbi:MAG: tetratricopeptide repeat protein [Deltaproteobacteria bacterium]|nr:tetratricopeptide repeat protein [Deltaproteobacteria bacterium]